jgi:hypothetical protein
LVCTASEEKEEEDEGEEEDEEEEEEEEEADDYDFIRSKQVCQSCITILFNNFYCRCHTVCCVSAAR